MTDRGSCRVAADELDQQPPSFFQQLKRIRCPGRRLQSPVQMQLGFYLTRFRVVPFATGLHDEGRLAEPPRKLRSGGAGGFVALTCERYALVDVVFCCALGGLKRCYGRAENSRLVPCGRFLGADGRHVKKLRVVEGNWLDENGRRVTLLVRERPQRHKAPAIGALEQHIDKSLELRHIGVREYVCLFALGERINVNCHAAPPLRWARSASRWRAHSPPPGSLPCWLESELRVTCALDLIRSG